ncbi:hypothetical protein TSUD_05460 [Trifolium subterraneum]|uniref:Bifunctional inhibitor/plant lipid transfer protein/seed storage helical domain-containing protein n=1 Tax=Trifolium subterraneum TaxID=3900 RepID=A0A2Z6MUE8_TRISU|nr:hypothetical protein TSUD_05460 [Trifolium subterraneum]
MAKNTALLVLFLLVAAILNGYGAEGVGRGNQLEKHGPVYKTEPPLFDRCKLLRELCLRNPGSEYCSEYDRSCPKKDIQTTAAKFDNPKAKNLP